MLDSNKNLPKRVERLENELLNLKQQIISLEKQLNEQSDFQEDGMIDQTRFVEKQHHTTIKMEKHPIELHEQKSEQIADDKQISATKSKQADTDILPETENPIQQFTKETDKSAKSHDSFEQLLGIWLPRVFMVVLILGVLWGLKVGMDKGWISYGVRIALGYIASVLIFYIGMKNIAKGHKLFGVTLIGGTIAIGILVTAAAYYLYGLLNYPVAMMISLVYIILGLIMSKKIKSETLTILSGIAGFLLPFLIKGTTVETWTFCLYVLLLFLTLFYIALSGKHKLSYYITFILFHLTLLVYTFFGLSPGNEMYIVFTALIQHLLLLLFYVKGLIARSIFTESIIYSNVIFMVGWIKLLENHQEVYVYGFLATLYVLFSIYGYSRKDIKLQSIFSAVAVFAISAFILSFNVENGESKLLLLLLNGAIGMWVGLYFKTIRTIIISSFIYVLTGLSVIAAVNIQSWISLQHLTWIGFIVTMIFIYYVIYLYGKTRFDIKTKSIDISLVVAQLVSLIYEFKLTDMVLNIKVAISDWSLYDHAFLFVMLVAIIMSFFAYKWKHGIYVSYIAVIEFIFIGLFFSISSLTIYTSGKPIFLFNVFTEVFYLIIFTLLFIMMAKGKFPKTNNLQQSTPVLAVISQIVYFFFFNKWYFAFVNVYMWEHDYVYIGHTIWMFLFAFLSISLGIRYSWKIVRYLGIILIGICLLKLFFIDLVNISIVIRAILFIVVGVIGLVYSRTLLKGNKAV